MEFYMCCGIGGSYILVYFLCRLVSSILYDELIWFFKYYLTWLLMVLVGCSILPLIVVSVSARLLAMMMLFIIGALFCSAILSVCIALVSCTVSTSCCSLDGIRVYGASRCKLLLSCCS